MRLISWLIALPVTLLAISFSASNLGDIPIRIWPIALEFSPPIPAFTFVVLLIGFVLGALTTWIGAGRTRSKAREAVRTSQKQAREITELEQKVSQQDTPAVSDDSAQKGQNALPSS